MVIFPTNLSTPPRVGEKAAEIRNRFGAPGAVHKPGEEVKVHGEPWFNDAGDKISLDELPEVTGERWFYSTGFMGTQFFLIYIENGSVDKVFSHRT